MQGDRKLFFKNKGKEICLLNVVYYRFKSLNLVGEEFMV